MNTVDHTASPSAQRGFTLVELVMMIVIIGILAVVALPRLTGTDVFQSRGIADQIRTALRYAQKIAIAQRGTVSANITSGANSDCGFALVGGNVQCQVALPAGVTVVPALPQTITFNALGQPVPNAQSALVVAGGGLTTTITVEAETGYVQ